MDALLRKLRLSGRGGLLLSRAEVNTLLAGIDQLNLELAQVRTHRNRLADQNDRLKKEGK